MRTTLFAVTVLGAALATKAALAGPPPFPETCCACTAPVDDATSAGIAARAFFCETVISAEQRQEFELQCAGVPGRTRCFTPFAMQSQVQTSDMLDCPAVLLEAGILCPAGRGAPVPLLGTGMLAGLALGLVGLGGLAARRRRRVG